jgi:hypothetical protein
MVICAVGACAAAQISGRVQAEDGRLLSSVTIVYSRRGEYPPGTSLRNIARTLPLPGREPFTRTLKPGPDGSFVLSNLVDGEYTVCAMAEAPYLSSCKWQPVQGVVLRSASDAMALPPIMLRRGAVIRARIDTAGQAVSAVHDPGSPQFNIGVLLVSGAYAGAELVSSTAGMREFQVVVPLEGTGRLMVASRQFELALAAPPPGVSLVAETRLTSYVPIGLARGESERVIALRIARPR